MNRVYLLNESKGMMAATGEVFANPAFGRGREVLDNYRRQANDICKMVIRLLRVVHYNNKQRALGEGK